MKKVLVISYFFPPSIHPRAYRWEKICAHFANAGYEVHVVCAKSHGQKREGQGQQGILVHEVGFSLRNYLFAKSKGVVHTKRSLTLFNVAKKIYDVFWKKIYWPDYACLWIPWATYTSWRLCRKHGIEKICTVSWPFSSHCVGLLLARFIRVKVWVADMGDPFSIAKSHAANNDKWYARLNTLAERAVLKRCSSVFTPSKPLKDLYLNKFSDITDLAKKMRVSDHMLQVKLDHAEAQPRQRSHKLLVYAGSLSVDNKNPFFFLEMFKYAVQVLRRNDLRLHFVGNFSNCMETLSQYQHQMSDLINIYPAVDLADFNKHLVSADVLVNIGSRSTFALPSKLIEYTATARPILNVSSDADDLSIKFLSVYPASVSIVEQQTHLPLAAKTMLGFIDNPPAGLAREAVQQLLRAHLPNAIAEQYLSSL